jgi:Flp pilus assembly protein TadG
MRLSNRNSAKVPTLGAPLRGTSLRSQGGQALVELAFMVPILVLLAVGVIEIGRYAYIGVLVGNAARAGAAYGSLNLANASSDPAVKAKVQQAAINDFQNNGQTGLTVASITTCGCDSNGTISVDTEANCDPVGVPPTCPSGNWVITIHVTASGTFSALFNYPGIPNPLDIARTSSMRVAKN